ncbi:MAG: hypothetical protein NTV92_00405 [Candidatus Bipolaricaulota bacterium]|nr:hypothetical protein [Candidatus Bipolaricaulota bacterium]
MKDVRRGMVVGLVLLIVAATTPLVVRWATAPRGPSLWIELPTGTERKVDLAGLRRLPQISRRGEVQNQFGNWRDGGTYTGVLLTDLLNDVSYGAVDVVAEDGYRVTIGRSRVEDGEYPMVLAYAFDGVAVPAWKDGFRVVVLPDDGRVSNEEYGAASAGSFWVKNVARIVVAAEATTWPAGAR